MSGAKVEYTCGCHATAFNGMASAVCLSHPSSGIKSILPPEDGVLFKSKDYSVVLAENGTDAVQANQNSPHVAFLEIVMTGHLSNRLADLTREGVFTQQERHILQRALDVLKTDATRRMAFPYQDGK